MLGGGAASLNRSSWCRPGWVGESEAQVGARIRDLTRHLDTGQPGARHRDACARGETGDGGVVRLRPLQPAWPGAAAGGDDDVVASDRLAGGQFDGARADSGCRGDDEAHARADRLFQRDLGGLRGPDAGDDLVQPDPVHEAVAVVDERDLVALGGGSIGRQHTRVACPDDDDVSVLVFVTVHAHVTEQLRRV